MTRQAMTLLIRAAEDRDLVALTDIYNHYVLHTDVTFDVEAVTVAQRRDWLAGHPTTGAHRLLVGELDGQGGIVGYASSSPFRPKAAYRTSVETSIYLHPDHRGRGYGRRLYQELLDILGTEPVHRAYAGIALPNDASVALHHALGFTTVGTYTEVGHKNGRYVDVRWYERPLP